MKRNQFYTMIFANLGSLSLIILAVQWSHQVNGQYTNPNMGSMGSYGRNVGGSYGGTSGSMPMRQGGMAGSMGQQQQSMGYPSQMGVRGNYMSMAPGMGQRQSGYNMGQYGTTGGGTYGQRSTTAGRSRMFSG